MSNSFEYLLAGRMLNIYPEKFALQANGAVVVNYGDIVVLVTACASSESREGIDFLPLTVDYEERLYAAGKIPGSFIRREGRPTQEAVVTSRLIDRSLRPLFPKGLKNDIQIVATVLSIDQENHPDTCALIGASAALTISDIPFEGPISAVHVGYINGDLVVNPTIPQMNDSLLDVIVVSTQKAVVMVEAGSKEISEDILLKAIKLGHEENQGIIKLQEEMRQGRGKSKMGVSVKVIAPELSAQIASVLEEGLDRVLEGTSRAEREQGLESLKGEVKERWVDSFPEGEINSAFETQLKAAVRKRILSTRLHIDGRRAEEVRTISSEVGLLPRTHGSGLFTRGETQVLTITTLGSAGQEQLLDGLGLMETRRFMHHYNFPPFSTGEVKRMGSPGRREIGHGALAERAIMPVLPSKEEFPYTIRLVSEVVSSQGSTSMASTCASILSLMDAGVPIKAPVAGIAMGLVTGEDEDHVVLTDIVGMEDAFGDMDFKVAGSTQGITAAQMDIKLQGISYDILDEALKQARTARLEILEKMKQTIDTSRSELSPHAPRMHEISIDPSKIGTVIGPGGRTIRSIIEETKATIEVKNDGTVVVGSSNEESAQKAIKMIEDLTKEVEEGAIYTGKVTRVFNFGAMVEVLPGKEGLVHISELANYHVPEVEDVVNIGDEIMVKVIGFDNLGRMNLSRKAVLDGASSTPEESRDKNNSAPQRRWEKPVYKRNTDDRRGNYRK